MNPLTDWSKILIGKLGRTTRRYKTSKLSELTYLEKTVDIAGFPGQSVLLMFLENLKNIHFSYFPKTVSDRWLYQFSLTPEHQLFMKKFSFHLFILVEQVDSWIGEQVDSWIG